METLPDRQLVRELARGEDLLYLGVAPIAPEKAFERFEAWLGEERHAGMRWMENHREARRDPQRLLEGARAALVFALPYADPDSEEKSGPRVARYARFDDYHKVLRTRCERVAEKLRAKFGGDFRAAVDTLPLLEKALAASTSEGFFGKNSLYLHPKYGSFFLLGEILTTLPIPPDARGDWDGTTRSEAGGCGPCRACQTLCPTGALDEAYRIDARRCLAYWTIEHRGTIPQEFWPHLKHYWFGCDLCQDACPYNQRTGRPLRPESLKKREYPPLASVATMTQRQYEEWFGGTAMTRAKRGGLMRNALIAMAVSGDPEFPRVLALAKDETEAPVAETARELEVAFPGTISLQPI